MLCSEAFREFGDFRTRPALDGSSMPYDEVLEMNRREFLDRLAMLLRVHVVLVRHRRQTGLVVQRVAGDAQRTGLVDQREAPAGVAGREDDAEAVVRLPVGREDVHRAARMGLRAG